MRGWEGERKKPQFFHQKGWIASNFSVKNNVSAILKTRQKNNTEMSRPEYSNGATPIHHRSTELTRRPKPSTAPAKSRRSREGLQSGGQGSALACLYDELLLTEFKHCNFKTTLNARKPLLFLRPYVRNNTASTIDQRKAEIYQEINNPDVASFSQAFLQTGPIEYLTEYAEPFASGREKPSQPRRAARHRSTLNVLREKLKRRCEMSFYQSKINFLKQA